MGRRRTDCRNEYKWKEGVEGGRRKEERFRREGGKEGERTSLNKKAKKWRGLINIHDLDCTMLHARIFERADSHADAAGTLTAATPSICAHTCPYRVAGWLIN